VLESGYGFINKFQRQRFYYYIIIKLLLLLLFHLENGSSAGKMLENNTTGEGNEILHDNAANVNDIGGKDAKRPMATSPTTLTPPSGGPGGSTENPLRQTSKT